MIEKLKEIQKKIKNSDLKSFEEVEQFRIKYLGKKGILTLLFEEFKLLSSIDKKKIGAFINELKKEIQEKIEKSKLLFSKSENKIVQKSDLTLPGIPFEVGARHPLSRVKEEIIEIFSQIGFTLSEGPEIEDDWHNFTALNIPMSHPARDMQDTFFIEKDPDILLRTHTSSVQIRYMENNSPPIRILSPGRVYRNEALSSRSHCMFHQIEGLYVDKEVSFGDLKETLLYFTKSLFGNSKIRLRPSFFPFTEPSAEVDIYWGLKTKTDYQMTKGTGWLEIMGCGMIDPQVLKNVNIDPEIYSGFAFGMGIERIALLLYQIEDIRLFFQNDVDFLKQFKGIY